jgi:hypothetical protein
MQREEMPAVDIYSVVYAVLQAHISIYASDNMSYIYIYIYARYIICIYDIVYTRSCADMKGADMKGAICSQSIFTVFYKYKDV